MRDDMEAWRLEADYYCRAMHAARRDRDVWRARFERLRLAVIVAVFGVGCVLGTVLRPHEWYAWIMMLALCTLLAVADFNGRKVKR